MKLSRTCPLCGEPVGWIERQAGKYACLYTCVRIVPHPNHLKTIHPDYLRDAERVAPPIFYTALGFLILLLVQISLIGDPLSPVAALAAVGFAVTMSVGWLARIRLIRRHRLRLQPSSLTGGF